MLIIALPNMTTFLHKYNICICIQSTLHNKLLNYSDFLGVGAPCNILAVMEAVCSSEMLAYGQNTTQHNIPENHHQHSYCHENLKILQATQLLKSYLYIRNGIFVL